MRTGEVTVDWLIGRLDDLDWDERSQSGMAWCPCHDDVGTSMKGLSVTKKRGKLYAYCHSCKATLTKVVKALEGDVDEVEEEDVPEVTVLPVREGSGLAWWVGKTGVSQDVWERLGVEEVAGGVAFTFAFTPQRKVRLRPKTITWASKELDAPALWPQPEDELPPHVMLVEGESDCGTAHAAGLPYALATTKGGAAALPRGWVKALAARGVSEVTICGDADETGRKFMDNLASDVIDAGLHCNTVHIDEVVDPFSQIKDLNGLWLAASSREEFLELVARCTHPVSGEAWGEEYSDFVRHAEEQVDWMVSNLIAPGDKVLIVGPQKSFKTWLMLDLTRTLTNGTPFLKHPEWGNATPRNVVLVEEEGSKNAFSSRVQKIDLQAGTVHILHRKGFRFTDDGQVARMIAFLRKVEADVVFFDPLQRMIPGVNENDSAETGVVWDQVQRLQQALPHLVVVIVHHANKGERLTWDSVRGSSRHAGEVDVGIFVDKREGEMLVAIDGRDISLDTEHGAFSCDVQITDDGFTLDATQTALVTKKATSQKDRVLEAVREGKDTRTKIMRATQLSDSTVRSHLKVLMDEGCVTEHDGESPRHPKTYSAVESGVA